MKVIYTTKEPNPVPHRYIVEYRKPTSLRWERLGGPNQHSFVTLEKARRDVQIWELLGDFQARIIDTQEDEEDPPIGAPKNSFRRFFGF